VLQQGGGDDPDLRLASRTRRSAAQPRQLKSAPSHRPGPSDEADPELDRQCFIVRDAKGQALAYVYSEEEAGRRAAAKLVTRDEARRIAVNFAKLPGRLRS
jgi:hypothetical protein